MWPEVTEVRRDSQGFFPLRVQGGFGLLPFFLKAKGTYAHMCIQLLHYRKATWQKYILMALLSLSPAFFAKLMAYSHTSDASLWASCRKHATAARRSSKWELHKWTWKSKPLQMSELLHPSINKSMLLRTKSILVFSYKPMRELLGIKFWKFRSKHLSQHTNMKIKLTYMEVTAATWLKR